MIWPFIYEALLPRLLTLTLCRQVNMMIEILDDDAYHLAFEARGDRRNSRGKKQPSFKDENMHLTCLIDNDHLNKVSGRIGPNRIPSP